jgi:hypothetical protein
LTSSPPPPSLSFFSGFQPSTSALPCCNQLARNV